MYVKFLCGWATPSAWVDTLNITRYPRRNLCADILDCNFVSLIQFSKDGVCLRTIFFYLKLTIPNWYLPKKVFLLHRYADSLTKWPGFYLQIVFADVKSANKSICICLANILFVHADAKKDANKLPVFAQYGTRGASLPDNPRKLLPWDFSNHHLLWLCLFLHLCPPIPPQVHFTVLWLRNGPPHSPGWLWGWGLTTPSMGVSTRKNWEMALYALWGDTKKGGKGCLHICAFANAMLQQNCADTKKCKRRHLTRPVPNCSFVDWIGLTKSQP